MAQAARNALLRLPQKFLFKGKSSFSVRMFDMSRFDEAHAMFQAASDKGDPTLMSADIQHDVLQGIMNISDVIMITGKCAAICLITH